MNGKETYMQFTRIYTRKDTGEEISVCTQTTPIPPEVGVSYPDIECEECNCMLVIDEPTHVNANILFEELEVDRSGPKPHVRLKEDKPPAQRRFTLRYVYMPKEITTEDMWNDLEQRDHQPRGKAK